MTPGGVQVRCPDCGKDVGRLGIGHACPGCGREFPIVDGVWNLLPTAMASAKVNEDGAHTERGLETWRRLLFHKRHWLAWSETRWLPEIVGPATRTFLEVGGGLCYASALAKARAPGAHVVATDVSPRYLANHALRVGAILETAADAYAAVDAETLPFADAQFDAIYSQVVLYRLPDPVRALREIRRVLAPGGRYLGIERASPWGQPFLAREARTMQARSAADGIAERPRRFREWQALVASAGAGVVSAEPGSRVTSPALRRLGNAVRPIYVAIRMSA